jgi:TolB-like protein/DNA-binding SARP family transcriptional activator
VKRVSRKARALLAFLAVESARWHSRERIAGLLWGRHAEPQARNSLSQALHELRQVEEQLGVRLVEREDGRLRLAAGTVDCDLHRFEALVSTDPLAAGKLYRDDLLADFELAEEPFAEWLESKRRHYQALLSERLLAAAAQVATAGDPQAAIRAARTAVELDPLDEKARCLLMRLLVSSGQRAEALRQYRVYEELLRTELNVAPAEETRSLADEIRRGHHAAQSILPEGPDPRLDITDPTTAGDRPAIAVLPFDNLSDDDCAWLCHGITDDLIFELTAYRWFRALARTATFRLADRRISHETARRILGATYLVTGRVRRAGSRLRVTVDLIDCRDGGQLWAGRYDRTLEDLFDAEAEIARQVASAIEPAVHDQEMRRVRARLPGTLTAYEQLQRGYSHFYRGTREDWVAARRCFEAAAESDPDFACAVAALAGVKYRDASTDVVNVSRERIEDARETAEQALRLDRSHPIALRWLAGTKGFMGDQEGALAAANTAVGLCPSYASAYSILGFVHDFLGNFDEARAAADETVRLRPHDPALHKCILARGIADYQTGDYQSAMRVIHDSQRTDKTWWMSNMMLAATAGQRGARDTAREAIERIRADQPGITLEIMLTRMRYTDPVHREHLAEGLTRAGWRDV